MRADELHDLLADAAGAEPFADPATGRAGVARVERRRRIQHATVVTTILVLGAVVLLRGLPLGGGGEGSIDTVDDPTEVPRLIPDPTPEGLVPGAFRDFPEDLPADAVGGDGLPSAGSASRVWLWRPEGAVGWDEAVGVMTFVLPAGSDPAPDPEPTTDESGMARVERVDGDVAVLGMARGDGVGGLDAFVRSAVVDGTGDLTTASPPVGWVLAIDGAAFDATGYGVGFDAPAHSALYVDGGEGDRQLLVLAADSPPSVLEVMRFLAGGEQRTVDVDGHAAWLLHRSGGTSVSVDSEGNPSTTTAPKVPQLWWYDDGVVVLVEAQRFTDGEAVDIARSLRPAGGDEWTGLRAAGEPSGGGDSEACTETSAASCATSGSFEGQGIPVDPGPTTSTGG